MFYQDVNRYIISYHKYVKGTLKLVIFLEIRYPCLKSIHNKSLLGKELKVAVLIVVTHYSIRSNGIMMVFITV